MDFFEIRTRMNKPGQVEIYPEFLVKKSKDIMTKGGRFYAVWDESQKMWSQDQMTVRYFVDKALQEEKAKAKENPAYEGCKFIVKDLEAFSTKRWTDFVNYTKSIGDHFHQLDEKLTFLDTQTKREDYASKRLSYSMCDGDISAYEEIVSTLYEPEEREKFEWAIGAILAGDTKKIQKFIVFHGPQGSGKSTVLDIIEKLFGGYDDKSGYCGKFDAKLMVSGNSQFALEPFSKNPLVAIDHEAKLDRIEDNSLINQIVSHDRLNINEKFKSMYESSMCCFLFMATNTPVKITDAKSGIIRRLIDVEPSGRLVKPESYYEDLISRIDYELGAIAKHCLNVYKKLGRTRYSGYIPKRMLLRTNPFFNFMMDNLYEFKMEDGISGNRLWTLYKQWCEDSGIDLRMKRFQVYEEAKSYFSDFKEFNRVNGVNVRNWYTGIKMEKFRLELDEERKEKIKPEGWLKLDCTKSLLDDILKDCPAQEGDKPKQRWEAVTTKLKDIDTSKVHWVKVPGKMIELDFDKKNEKGEKDFQLNKKAAEQYPKTYSELSKGGEGIHLHYWYDGDPNDLSRIIEEGVEVKVSVGDFALRRRLSKCNDIPIAHISSGLPLRQKKVLNKKGLEDEKHLKALVIKALKKEIEPYATKTSMDFIDMILKQAKEDGLSYDLMDLDQAIYAFAASSTHNAQYCIDKYYQLDLRWPRNDTPQIAEESVNEPRIFIPEWRDESPIVFFDVEVFPNLFLVNYKTEGEKECIRLINPKPSDIETLFNMKLVGFNCRGYDNFLLYACYLGYSNEDLFKLSQDIIIGGNRCPFREALNISWTDVYDFSSVKQSLKKFEIELGIHHLELGLPWDEPVPEEMWPTVAEYCDNDVIATEAVFNARQADFTARKILAEIADMTVNDTTNQLTTKIIFGDVRDPQKDFVYPDLKKLFPKYRFEDGKSYYGDELIGEGGRVYSRPGIYYNVVTFDVASMHPSSIIAENGFGPYTERFKQLMDIRIAIKHKDFDKAKQMLDGKLAKYLDDPKMAKQLSGALKIAINSVYGLTAAKFTNKFKDPRNVDNWVAKRGALFMESLRLKVQEMGGNVVHIKTDSIKVCRPTKEIENFILDYGKQFGYNFEVEDIYEKICLVNDAVYIAKRAENDPGWLDEKVVAISNGLPEPTRWTATGAQFQHPYIFKELFSKEPIVFGDYCETKTVKTDMYLDMNEGLPDISAEEKRRDKLKKLKRDLEKDLSDDADQETKESTIFRIDEAQKEIDLLDEVISKGHKYQFVGKAGNFCPIMPSKGGGILYRKGTNGSYDSVAGTKGWRWMESEKVKNLKYEKFIDMSYFRDLADVAVDTIRKFGDYDLFIKDADEIPAPPWSSSEHNSM